MFEDKRFKNQNDDSSNNSFFMPDNTGLKDGSDNLNFGEQPTYRKSKPKNNKNPKNKKFLKVLLVIFIFGLLVISGYFVFEKFINNPYNVYKNAITYGYEYLDNKIKDVNSKNLDYDKNKDILSTSGTLSINTNLMKELKDYEFKYKLGIDLDKEMIDTNLLINQNSKKIIDFEGYLRDKKILLNLKDVYNKYLQVSDVSSFLNIDGIKEFSFDYNILNDITKIVSNTLIKNLDKNKMSTEKTKLKVQNNNLSVISNNYTLSALDVKKIYQDIINNIINDNKVIDSLADTFNLRKAEIKEVLESLKDNEMILNNLKEIEFKIYTNGITNKVVGGKVLFDKKEIISFTNHKNVLNIKIGNQSNTLEIIKNSKDTKVIYSLDNKEIVSIIITKNLDKTNYEFLLEIEKIEVEGNLEVEVKRVANKKITTSIVFETKGKMDKDAFEIEINLDNITQVGGTIQSIPNNIVVYDDLSSSEKKDIQNKFKALVEKLPFGYLFKDNNIEEPIDYCEIATDCDCLGTICTCSYLDQDGIEQRINCLNKNTSTE